MIFVIKNAGKIYSDLKRHHTLSHAMSQWKQKYKLFYCLSIWIDHETYEKIVYSYGKIFIFKNKQIFPHQNKQNILS
jgi:hypothetical protein